MNENQTTTEPVNSEMPSRTVAEILEDFATLARLDGEPIEAFLEATLTGIRGMLEDELGKRRPQFAFDEAKRLKAKRG